MSFEIWGFEGEFHLNFPPRTFGFIIIGIYILVLLAIVLSQRDRGRFSQNLGAAGERNLFLLLGLAQVLLTQLFILRLELPGFDPLQGNVQDHFVTSFALLGALPWMI